MAEMKPQGRSRVFIMPANCEPLAITREGVVYADESGVGTMAANPHITWTGIAFDE